MELAHSLLLNEDALSRIPESKRSVFVYEWLRFLDKVLIAAQKSDIKESQNKLIDQLTQQISCNPGPPTRKLLSRCLATIFSVGDTFALFETINKCNDVIRNRDDSPSYLPTRLAAVSCIGGMYEKLGRMVGRSYEETVQLLIKSLKNSESQGRCEIMLTMQKVIEGLGNAGSNCYKDIYKASKGCMTDRSMSVRSAAAKCMTELCKEAAFMYTTELDAVVALCFRALDGSSYNVRCDVAVLLGTLLACTQDPKKKTKGKSLSLEDVLNMLSNGFLKGNGGFLRGATGGEMLKGGGTVNREVRVGVTHAYIEFVKVMGSPWFERNIADYLQHILSLSANPKACPTHVDAVYTRKCVLFILRSVLGGVLSDKAQITAAKEICILIIKQMNVIDLASETDRGQPGDVNLTQHTLVCALGELGCLVESLGTSASPLVSEPSTGIIEPVVSVLIHPMPAARLAAAWCLRSIAVALHSQLTILIERCMNRMHHLKSSPEAISGYSFALTALLGSVRHVSLGIPHAKGKQIFAVAEELLRTASQNSRLSLQRTQSGWLLLSALMTLGPSVVRNHLPRMLLLWRNAFPRSAKELEAEKARGDAFTWQVTMDGRAGALGAIQSFIVSCRELVTEDVIRRLLPPLECALTFTGHIPIILRTYGNHLKASAAMVRLRLYDVLALLPPETYEGAFGALLRELVAEFTLTDNPANTTTSLLRAMCHADDNVILGSWLQETDHKAIEDQLQPNSASGSGALEHDVSHLYMKLEEHETFPGPLPLGVSVIDSSVKLYGLVFPRVANKHRLQMLEHFSECIKQAKSSRQQAVQINIFTAVLCALKVLAESKSSLGPIDVRKAAVNLVLDALGSNNAILRCAAGEAVGRMTQVVGETKFIAEMAQYSFDRLKSARDVVTRTGNSLALGCLHRYVGGLGSGHHLGTSVSILLALAQDSASPVVQMWSLHALALIADSGGPMFRSYVEPTLSLVLSLLLSVPQSSSEVHQCLGKCLAALITTIGPELAGNNSSISTARLSCLVCCAVMQDHPDAMVKAEAISCLQQLHLFAPKHVNLTTLVPHLCDTLTSSHLLLRRAAVACLRQLVQREAKEVSEHALALTGESKDGKIIVPDTGLEGALFAMLDLEKDRKLMSDVQDTLVSMLQTLASNHLTKWLTLCRDVLQASTESTPLSTPVEEVAGGKDDDEDDVADDDAAGLHVGGKKQDMDQTWSSVAPRWPTRVFAIQCLLKIMAACEADNIHTDLTRAKELQKETKSSDYLVLHLSNLVRMAFIAATSDSDKLRLAGLAALDKIITKFCKVPEPEFPGHVILEQYQAQVGAALRPAFTPETAPDVTAAACDVCSCWIGSGVARDLNDLRRVHQLLVSSLAKLKEGKDVSPLYSESASTMEKLSVLKAWAEVYIVAMDQDNERQNKKNSQQTEEDEGSEHGESLLSLVQPEMVTLSKHWLAALKDHALLLLSPEFSSQLPSEGGSFYTSDTMEQSKPHYRKVWPPILYAVSLWLRQTGFTNAGKDDSRPANMKADDSDADRFHLLLGICVEALVSPTSSNPLETVNMCLRAIHTLLDDAWPRAQLGVDPALSIEMLNVLHRVILTREGRGFQLVLQVMKDVIKSAQECLEAERQKQKELTAESSVESGSESKVVDLGEGSDSGDLVPGKSLIFAALEVCLCVFVRHLPAINPSHTSTGFQSPGQTGQILDEDGCQQIATALQIMAELPGLASEAGTTSILPTILHLTTGVLFELGTRTDQTVVNSSCLPTALQTLKTLCKTPGNSPQKWISYLQSALQSLINHAKPDLPTERSSMDIKILLLSISIMISSCPEEVVLVPSILKQVTDIYKTAWNTEDTQIRLKCLQSLTSILHHPNTLVYTPFIHNVCLGVLEYMLDVRSSKPQTEPELAVIVAAMMMLKTLLDISSEKNKVDMLTLLVPLFSSYLLSEKELVSASKVQTHFHEVSLSQLLQAGTSHPEHFRIVMQALPGTRNLVESAVKVQQIKKNSGVKQQTANNHQNAKVQNVPQKPSIQLKTNFNF